MNIFSACTDYLQDLLTGKYAFINLFERASMQTLLYSILV